MDDSVHKWILGVVGTVLASWMGFMSIMLVNMNNIVTKLDTEINWIKNQSTQGKLEASEAGSRRDLRLNSLSSCCESVKERVIALETKQKICLGKIKVGQ